uniref:LEM domain-containing protein n=1 Tax=Trichuris muris TaxID=70415 RepID=A0A5S6QHS2_TRIMR
MDNISSLSNQQLRRELIEHGFNPGPVLSTTRAVYEEKLKAAILEKANQNRRTPMMVTRKSSRRRIAAEPKSETRQPLPPPRMASLETDSGDEEEGDEETFEGEESYRAVSDSETESQRSSPVCQTYRPVSQHVATPYPSPANIVDYTSPSTPKMDAYQRRPVKMVYSSPQRPPPRGSILVKFAAQCTIFVVVSTFVYMLLRRVNDLMV